MDDGAATTSAPALDWSAAERIAADARRRRLDPPARYARLDRWLRPAVVVLWVASIALSVQTRLSGGMQHDALDAAASISVAVVLVLGCWWLFGTGRLMLRGNEASIRGALPFEARRSVRRQLAGKDPADPAHVAVVVELARQQRRLNGGQVAFLAWYVPLYLSIADGDDFRWTGVPLLLGAAVLVVGAVLAVIGDLRLARFIREHLDGA